MGEQKVHVTVRERGLGQASWWSTNVVSLMGLSRDRGSPDTHNRSDRHVIVQRIGKSYPWWAVACSWFSQHQYPRQKAHDRVGFDLYERVCFVVIHESTVPDKTVSWSWLPSHRSSLGLGSFENVDEMSVNLFSLHLRKWEITEK